MKFIKTILVVCATLALAGCDDNDEAVYGKESGLPVNCRAYIQVSVDAYRNKTYPTDDIMNGIERNCGAYGHAWKNNR